MITDDERREVAQELRKLTAPGCIRYAEEFYEELRGIVARDLDGSFEGVANSLADLIEPQPIDGAPQTDTTHSMSFTIIEPCCSPSSSRISQPETGNPSCTQMAPCTRGCSSSASRLQTGKRRTTMT